MQCIQDGNIVVKNNTTTLKNTFVSSVEMENHHLHGVSLTRKKVQKGACGITFKEGDVLKCGWKTPA